MRNFGEWAKQSTIWSDIKEERRIKRDRDKTRCTQLMLTLALALAQTNTNVNKRQRPHHVSHIEPIHRRRRWQLWNGALIISNFKILFTLKLTCEEIRSSPVREQRDPDPDVNASSASGSKVVLPVTETERQQQTDRRGQKTRTNTATTHLSGDFALIYHSYWNYRLRGGRHGRLFPAKVNGHRC